MEVRSHCPTRERETDATTKPEGKALKTFSAAPAMQGTIAGRGTNTLEPEPEEEESSEEDEQSALLGFEKNWKHVKTVKQAREAAKKMYRTLPGWKLADCVKQLCGDTPNILGAARASSASCRGSCSVSCRAHGRCYRGVQVFKG